MKKVCATVSDPAVPSPRIPADRTASETKLVRPSSVNVKRAGVTKGAKDGGEQRPRKGYKNQSPQSSGDAEPNTAWRTEMRRGTHALRDVKNHLADLHQKALSGTWGAEEVRAATARAAQLLREAERLQRRAAELQNSNELSRSPDRVSRSPNRPDLDGHRHCPEGYQPGDAYEPPLVHELRMVPPSTLLASAMQRPPSCGPGSLRSKSELELSRRLSESLDMQERLAADNADLDVKRYILYKELMVKEQRLETARAQAARLQAELKLLARDNARLQAAVNTQSNSEIPQRLEESEQEVQDNTASGEPAENYIELVKQLSELEEQVRVVQEMSTTKHADGLCDGRPCPGGGGPNICYEPQAGMPPMPPTQRDCHKCPPCPASCNPDAALTPAEKEVIQLKEKLQKSEDECKSYIGECALLRSEVLKVKEEAETERCVARETKARLRKLEMKFEGLTPKTKMQGPTEKAFETEVNVQTLRQMLREANTEIDEQLTLITEMEKQLQDYRLKYLQAQQLAEEQTRQLAALDADNVRISEQINYEIQRVKIKFQEKLQELTPLPKLLQATHRQLRDAQQQQAIAEHRTEQLARELMCARDKIAVLEYELNKPAEKQPGVDRVAEAKLLTATQQRVTQLMDENAKIKAELERSKNSVIRLEESLLACGSRFQEKIDENRRLLGDQQKIKEEAERAIARANHRTETVRKCMQSTIAELEMQLAASRAKVAAADRERDELRLNMENQVVRLQDNCEMAHKRVQGLATQVAALRKIAPDTAPDSRQPCLCKDFIETLAPTE
ncbi:CAP-Gly domain-containing linker protein 1-like [Cydia splendana]|uniref:CAP-Gly domain-containing linker protein 1-like n=1 Tax=Cydia splendana TaxID=1100963 RepID=UPI0028F48795